jgi:hypothetical protein
MDDDPRNQGRRPSMRAGDWRSTYFPLLATAIGSIVLLVLAFACPESRKGLTMRGFGNVESEVQGAQAVGYYERLIGVKLGCRRDSESVTYPQGWIPFAMSGIVEPLSTYQRFRMRPDLNRRWNDSEFKTNRLGFRGPEIQVPKPARTFRVVILGSSNTLGHGVDNDAVYTRRIEYDLDRWSGADIHFEVVNLAVSGDSPTQRLLRLQTEVERLQPDWILSDVTVLDYSLEELHLQWVVANGIEVPFDFVREALRQSGVSVSDSPAQFHAKLAPYAETIMDQTYSRWATFSKQLCVPFTVVLLPRADAKAKNPNIVRQIKGFSGRNGLECLDLSETFAELNLDDYRIAPWDPHPNARGHRLISGRLVDELLEHQDFASRLMRTGPYRPFSERNGG